KQPEVALAGPKPQTVTGSETATVGYPPWRVELKERVRQIREKRNTGDLVATPPSPISPVSIDDAKRDRNPIVESGLNRIRRSSHAPSIPQPAGVSPAGAGPVSPTSASPTSASPTSAGVVSPGARVTTKLNQPETARAETARAETARAET